ncbi:FtsK/SpoIIIE domain-containing protein [Streptomyces sp. NPDC093248]|uniref:FtsK/SpoIIIE domain-containing protein n=1 Tax=Streptomyces sp. NPDC093248 TaxID=3155072 RepID=UPI003444DF71
MRLTLTAVDPRDGRTADVVLDADPGTPVREVARALERRLTGKPGEEPPPLYADGLPLDAGAALGRCALREGAVVSLHTPAGCPPREVTGIVELRVAGGPDAGPVHRLGLGRTDIGRGPAAHVRVDDPALAEHALTLTVAPDGRCTVRASGARRVSLDGVPLTARADSEQDGDGTVRAGWPLGSQLAVGGSLLELDACEPPDVTPRPSEDGTCLDFERPRRPTPPAEGPLGVPPYRSGGESVRDAYRSRALYLAAAVAGLLATVVLLAATGRWYAALLAVQCPLCAWFAVRAHRRLRGQEHAAALAREAAESLRLRGLRGAAPSPGAVLSLATGPGSRLWERRPGDLDHLSVRLGTRQDDDTPVVLPLAELGVLGVAGPDESARALGRWAVAQIAVLHSPLDVSLYVLTSKGARESWDWLRWLPHLRPAGGDATVALGMDAETVGARIGELLRLLSERSGEAGGADARPDVVVVCDGSRRLRSLPGMVQLLREGPAAGIHLLCLDDEERFLPAECRAVVVAELPGSQGPSGSWRAFGPGAGGEPDTGTRPDDPTRPEARRGPADRPGPLLRVEAGDERMRDVRPDFVSARWCAVLARSLAPLRDASGGTDSATLPARSRLLDVLALEPPDGREIAERWTARGPSTFAAIGETYDGPFGIDLRRDGPHALIAGTSGSGKSELLRTIIASLAVANSPEHLTFVLVDYGGGASFQDCARLPHTVGTVTDLDPYLVQRVLDSFAAELRRREQLLAALDAKNIDDYHHLLRRTPGEPLPRLVVVIDEIATMARELPDFISGVINVAQRGRSLGVHLILATQRPSGAVSAEIRANTNLRIALRVTDGGESQDIVDSPEAATIPRSVPGRGYARLGHASLIPFQAGRVAGPRHGAAASARRAPWTASLTWSELGRPAPARPAPAPDPDAPVTTDFDALVGAVREAHAALGVPPQHSPWLPPLPGVLTLDEAGAPVDGESGDLPAVAFAVEDRPAEQRRRPVRVDLAHFGHLLVAGAPRTGRTQALRTVAGALARVHSCADVHLYGIDCGHNGLAALAGLPHCGALVSRRESERVARLLSRLTDELDRRQDAMARSDLADITAQRGRAEPAGRWPHLVVLLDGWEGWLPVLGEYEHGRLTDELFRLLREGAPAGLHLVVSGDRQLLSGRISSLTEERYALRLPDRSDYALLGIRPGAVPEDLPAGRAVRAGSGTETQFALLTGDPSARAQTEALAAVAVSVAARDAAVPEGRRPFRVDALPGRIGFEEAWRLRDPDASRSPLWALAGVGGDELTAYGPDLAQGVPAFVVAGPPGSGRSTALLNLARSCLRQGARLVVAAPRPSPLRELAGREGVVAVFTDGDIGAEEFDRAVAPASAERPTVVVMDDAEVLDDCAAGTSLKRLLRHGAEHGLALVLGGAEEEVCAGFSGWQVDAKKARRGLLLSPQASLSGELIGHRVGRSAVGYPVQPCRGLLHLGDGRLLSVLVPSD